MIIYPIPPIFAQCVLSKKPYTYLFKNNVERTAVMAWCVTMLVLYVSFICRLRRVTMTSINIERNACNKTNSDM